MTLLRSVDRKQPSRWPKPQPNGGTVQSSVVVGSAEDSLSQRDFKRICELVYSEAGIRLGPEKKIMIEGRLKKRLKALNMDSYGEYCEHLFGQAGRKTELVSFIDVVTTNKTDFFRESGHFDFLAQTALPELASGAASGRPAIVWSAGCSTGEEPYTLGMVLSEFAASRPGFRFRILATDISTIVLSKAQMAVYAEEATAPVPANLKRKYFLRSRDRESARVRVVPELRQAVEFRRLNFMDAEYGWTEKADAIFCRNVLIYFDRATQENILRKLCRYLHPGGFLFVGHSESLHDMSLPVTPLGPALYRKQHARA